MKEQRWSRSILLSILCLILLGARPSFACGREFRRDRTDLWPGEATRVTRFTESDAYFVNPGMGAVAPADRPDRTVNGSLVLAALTWKQLEPSRGRYDFANSERIHHYEEWIRRENQWMFGLAMDVPHLTERIGFEVLEIPQWLYAELRTDAIRTLEERMAKAGTEKEREEWRKLLVSVQNDRERIDAFNRARNLPFNAMGAQTLDVPEVGTFYRYRIPAGEGWETRCGFSPNYASPRLVRYHGELMRALAQRYDNAQTYAVIMGSVGHWGEMHTYFIEPGNSGRYPDAEVAALYEEEYAKCFRHVQVSVRYPRGVAVRNGYGLHSHAFGDAQSIYDWHIDFYENGYTDAVSGAKYPAMRDFWKQAPSGGEFLYTGDARYLMDDRIESTLRQVRDTHLTWFNELWYGLTPEAQRNQERLFATIGYRFFPEWVGYSLDRRTQVLSVDVMFANAGTAPLYRDWPLRAVLVDERGLEVASRDFPRLPREWMPGERAQNSLRWDLSALARGRYGLYIGIFDPETGRPVIRFTVEEGSDSKRYYIGSIQVK